MKRVSAGSNLWIIALLSTLALAGCGRQTETHDPDVAPAAQPTSPGQEDNDAASQSDSSAGTESSADDSSVDSQNSGPNSMGQLICTDPWFEWVNQQVLSIHSQDVANQYPSGLPAVGSDEWFAAVDKLTGGDGAHGPDGGSDEWCFMMQQRLSPTGSDQE
ncbi:hypothetical protein ACNKU7_06975 [Microbulbifer sp. SA54]|uniref:hypothetical protein n=1 Tax=Microbulbifer sp. SA54 TaxID=3401577 RepID=UPI003AAFDD94